MEPKTISTIKRGEKTYRYDPEQQLYSQTLALDRELVRIGYYDIMAKARERLDAPDLSMSASTLKLWRRIEEPIMMPGDKPGEPSGLSFLKLNDHVVLDLYPEFTPAEVRQRVFTIYVAKAMAKTEGEDAYQDAVEYRRLVQERAQIYTQGLRDAHAAMTQKGGHEGLLIHLLVPDGMEYGTASIAAIREALPRFSMEEVESVISNFLTSGRLSKRLTPDYLIVSKPLPEESMNSIGTVS